MRPFTMPVVAACLVAAACSEAASTAPPAPALAASGAEALQLYGMGSREGLGSACDAAGYRQFDFWVGHWNVRPIRPDGSLGLPARSIIEKEVDGCVIEENWQGNARSMNSFDAGTGTYNQQYFDAFGSHLILSGGLRPDGAMSMRGTTFFFCAQCPGGVFPLVSDWVWTAFTPDSVQQRQNLINGLSNLPMPGGFDGRYVRAASVTLNPTPATGPCTNNPLNRQFDFAVGSWTITQGAAIGVAQSQGGATSSEVTRELAGCLIEERVQGAGGYQGWSFAGWNQSEEVWFRTYANNLGDRIFLRGGLDGANMVMTGHRSRADGTMTKVRVTWSAEGAERVVERWERSADGGATYEAAGEVVRVRKG
jgi:hypothetical protein